MVKLFVALKVFRKEFIMEDFIGSDNIFALVRSGSFYMESGGVRHTVSENEGAVFRKNVLYHRRVVTPVTMYLFRYASDAPAFEKDHVVFRNISRVLSTFEMLDMLDTGVFKNDFEYRSHIFDDLVVQYAMENGIASSSDVCIEQAIVKIKKSLHRGVDLSKIAKESELSYVQFLRRFKAYTSFSPSEYVNVIRLQKAENMLVNTDLRIKDIAASCGFENEYYFSNFFKKHKGVSPSVFRAASS